MADKPNLNYFKDPTTNLWREPKTDADFATFQAKQPKAYDTYMKTYGTSTNTAAVPSVGTYTADGTRIGSGTASNNINNNYYDNVVNSVDDYTNGGDLTYNGSDLVAKNKMFADEALDTAGAATDAGTSSGWGFSNPFGKDGALSTDVKGAGGSNFSSAAAGLGSLYGIYAAHQGIGAAKDALNFQKQQYADQKAEQARANKKQDDFGLALASALPAKRVG